MVLVISPTVATLFVSASVFGFALPSVPTSDKPVFTVTVTSPLSAVVTLVVVVLPLVTLVFPAALKSTSYLIVVFVPSEFTVTFVFLPSAKTTLSPATTRSFFAVSVWLVLPSKTFQPILFSVLCKSPAFTKPSAFVGAATLPELVIPLVSPFVVLPSVPVPAKVVLLTSKLIFTVSLPVASSLVVVTFAVVPLPLV